MNAIIFDTETTAIDDADIIEAAYTRLRSIESLEVAELYQERFRPSKPISMGAMATHHIMDEDLEGCRPSSAFALPTEIEFLIGHNVDFDWKAAGSPPVKRVCTLALCRYLWPKTDSHTQSAMLYMLERTTARAYLRHAHSAVADIGNCRVLLRHIIAKTGVQTWDALYAVSEVARVPAVMTFGKHKGTAIKDVPGDYKAWLLRQPDCDPYLAQALRA